jgi:hypothetical protein
MARGLISGRDSPNTGLALPWLIKLQLLTCMFPLRRLDALSYRKKKRALLPKASPGGGNCGSTLKILLSD